MIDIVERSIENALTHTEPIDRLDPAGLGEVAFVIDELRGDPLGRPGMG